MDVITFFVPGLPVAQPRQRTRVMALAGRMIAQNYTPKTAPVNAFKAAIRLAASQAYPGGALDGPCRLKARFVFPRPQSMTRKSGNPPAWKSTKPDWDNIGKAVSDALTGLLFRDDGQLALVEIEKRIAGDGEQAGTWIEVATL